MSRAISVSVVLLAVLCCSSVPSLLGCISFGPSADPVEPHSEKKEVKEDCEVNQPLSKADEIRRKEEKDKEGSGEVNLDKQELPQLNDAFIKTYLKEFGYLKSGISGSKSKELDEEVTRGIRHFQEFMGILPATGKMDFQSTSQMVRKRCSNPDLLLAEELNPIWERSTLKWNLVTDEKERPLPKGFEAADLREMIRQAFYAWEIVISMDFTEETNSSNADILFLFGGEEGMEADRETNKTENKVMKPRVPSATTGLGVAFGTEPVQSKIWLHHNENWSTFQVQEEGKLDIFLVLIHEIGHTLGLRHSSDKNSVMFPIFEKDAGEQLPVISNDDVERLRALYDPSENSPDPVEDDAGGKNETNNTKDESNGQLGNQTESALLPPPKCPTTMSAATQASNGELVVFMDGNCWRFSKDRRPIGDGPKAIGEIFPGAPATVDVAISAGNLTVLIQERTLYGFIVDYETGHYKPVDGFPRSLHSRVLFYPEAAFPLTNGSVILIRDDVFATYDLATNEPTMLNDKTVYFPNLPADFRAGILQQVGGAGMELKTFYWMFNNEAVFTFDATLHHILNVQTLADFLKCQQSTMEEEANTERINPKANVLLHKKQKLIK